jgi:tetratricopeptide (TPR) repeat protein
LQPCDFTTKTQRSPRPRSYCFVFFALFVSLWCSAQTRAQREERALDLLEQDRFAEARALLEALVGEAPDDARMEAYLASAEIHTGDPVLAIERLRRLIAARPQDTDLDALLGEAYSEDHDWALAEKQWRAVLEKRPNSEEAHFQRARALLQLGRLDEGLKEVARATEINLRRSDAHALQGNILASLGRTEEAVKEWNQALARDPNNSAALAGLAVYLRSSQPDTALEYARRAVDLSEWRALGPIRILALVYRSRGDFGQAREVVQKALGKFPNDPMLRAELRVIDDEQKKAAAAGGQGARAPGKPPPADAPLGDVARYYREQKEGKQGEAKKSPPQ